MSELDKWIEAVKDCKYLPENDLKKLCDIVCEVLLEESNIQPVSTPVTVCGDIHGQVRRVCLILVKVLPLYHSSMTWKNFSDVGVLYQTQITYLWEILLIEDTIA